MDSFLELNNNGITQLEVGEYENAAKLFREALDAIHTFMKCNDMQQNQLPPFGGLRRRQVVVSETMTTMINDNDVTTTTKSSSTTTTNKRKVVQHENEGHDAAASSSRKRQRRMTTTPSTTPKKDEPLSSSQQVSPLEQEYTLLPIVTTTTTSPALLGRPLWLELPKQKPTNNNTMRIFVSSILYNLAYAFHQMGMTTTTTTRKSRVHLQRALDTYTMAFRHSIHGRSPVVLFVTCHNLQQLIMHIRQKQQQQQQAQQRRDMNNSKDDDDEYTRRIQVLEAHKTSVLRRMSCSGGRSTIGPLPCPEQGCRVVLAMLGLKSINSPAAAA